MKKNLVFLCVLFNFSAQAQFVTIPDANLRNELMQLYPSCFNGLQQMDTTCNQVINATFLYVQNSSITDLEGVQYFDSVTDFDCSGNQLVSLPQLPPILISLKCQNNLLTTLPTLPTTVQYLYCQYNQLSSLPALHNSIEILNCNNNQLSSLPSLPIALQNFHCYENKLTSLPALPVLLNTLICSKNQLSSLPKLPSLYLYTLRCDSNLLTSLPSLPDGLNNLHVQNNPLLDCLPLIPNSLQSLIYNNTAISCTPNPGNNGNLFGLPLCVNGSMCEPRPTALGRVFSDVNNSGFYEEGTDNLLTNWSVTNSAGWVTTTNQNGQYQLKLDSGVVNTFQLNPLIVYSTFTPANYSVTPLSQGIQGNNFDFSVEFMPNVRDLTVHIAPGAARPGFTQRVTASVNSLGTVAVNNVTLKVLIPTGFSFLNAAPAITAQSADTLIWSNFNVDMFGHHMFDIEWTIDSNILIGSPYTILAWIDPTAGDTTPVNNHTEHNGVIVGSYDPNDKTVADTITLLNELDKELLYTIRFQNTGTDTAFNIVLRDQLSENLDWGTFRRIGASHNNNFLVRDKGILEIFFPNVLLPDSNVNESLSHGFFQYAIKPKATLSAGDSIKNTANIYFDYNAPIITNTVTSAVQNAATGMTLHGNLGRSIILFPNPANDNLNIQYDLHDNKKAEVQIADMSGRIIMQVNLPTNAKLVTVSVAGFQPGIYLYKCLNGGVVVNAGKMVVK